MTSHAGYGFVGGVVSIGIVSIAGCNQLIGFKDVSVEADAPTLAKDAPIDTPVTHDAMPDPQLFGFITDAGFQGGFGATTGARATADAKCQDKYNATFDSMGLGCTNIHAVIQIDDNVDSLARMKITFPIPLTTEVKRATVDHTPLAPNWDDFVNPNEQLLAPVTTDASPQRFWSGRSDGGTNLSCTNWTSSLNTQSGTAGDAAATFDWTADANVTCETFQHFVCVCW